MQISSSAALLGCAGILFSVAVALSSGHSPIGHCPPGSSVTYQIHASACTSLVRKEK